MPRHQDALEWVDALGSKGETAAALEEEITKLELELTTKLDEGNALRMAGENWEANRLITQELIKQIEARKARRTIH